MLCIPVTGKGLERVFSASGFLRTYLVKSYRIPKLDKMHDLVPNIDHSLFFQLYFGSSHRSNFAPELQKHWHTIFK
jgi:hypothetical protein